MKMHLQATENLPNAMFSRGVVPLGRGIKTRKRDGSSAGEKFASGACEKTSSHFSMIKVENATQIRPT